MARDIAEAQGEVAAPSPTGRSSKVMSCWACSSEGKEGSRREDPGRSWEAESCRGGGEKKEDDGVPPTAPRQGVRGRGHPIGGGWRIPGHGVQVQGGCHQR